jgi:hypothetical protein
VIPSPHSQEQIPIIILDFILPVAKMKLLLPNPPQGVIIPVLVSPEYLIYTPSVPNYKSF